MMTLIQYTPLFNEGDRVSVTLPAGEYLGTVIEILREYNWTGETWYVVEGDEPVSFYTICREQSVKEQK